MTAVVLEGRKQFEVVAATYGISKGRVSKLVARYCEEGEAAFEPRSRHPQNLPNAIPAATVTLIVRLREKLTNAGTGRRPDTLAWHLAQHHQIRVSVATISRYLTKLSISFAMLIFKTASLSVVIGLELWRR
jgi:transposase